MLHEIEKRLNSVEGIFRYSIVYDDLCDRFVLSVTGKTHNSGIPGLIINKDTLCGSFHNSIIVDETIKFSAGFDNKNTVSKYGSCGVVISKTTYAVYYSHPTKIMDFTACYGIDYTKNQSYFLTFKTNNPDEKKYQSMGKNSIEDKSIKHLINVVRSSIENR